MQSPFAYFKPTEKAGRFVAGRNNPGVGVPMLLSRREAQYDVDLGALVEEGTKIEPVSPTVERDDTLSGGGSDTQPGPDGNDTVAGGDDTLSGGGAAKPKAPARRGKAK